MTPMLSMRDLRKNYGALKVTDGVTLDIPPGELHAIIGPNGAGKTTLLSQLSGETAPDSGKVVLDGQDVTAMPMQARVRLGLARSFQITSILPSFTVLENVATAVQARSGSSFRFAAQVAADRVLNDEAMGYLDAVGLADKAGRIAGPMSHGEHRQLEIATALATRPRMLLLDEPLAGTSGREADLLVDLLQELRGTLTIALIEHDMQAVFALADRISVLVYGRLIASGTPEAIRGDAQVRAAYLGDEEAAHA
ncbi:ABC transporter ATP-binding protein [Paracoccus suum]|uniref:ABC transporter ATP-binding protein n=1 Tax=Paracoccus suum TaxID=2259340 RepID=A0A344PG25_9RHOB|nr:ABC transporter ATP-binding protein [Paracoccus suum]AXC48330.1 ABC transporter ATP-binding protein [Paracoccus suum]